MSCEKIAQFVFRFLKCPFGGCNIITFLNQNKKLKEKNVRILVVYTHKRVQTTIKEKVIRNPLNYLVTFEQFSLLVRLNDSKNNKNQ